MLCEVAKIHEDLSECEFIDTIRTQNIYPADYPENYNNVMVDENFIAIYKRQEDQKDLNPIGNFYRRKSIHNDILRTIERMQFEKIDFSSVENFQSDHFKIEVMIMTRSPSN